MSEKDLKKRVRVSFDYRTIYNNRTYFLKWFDNKCVVVGSSFAGVEWTDTVERYDLAQKKVKIDCPDMVSQYNRFILFIYLFIFSLKLTNLQNLHIQQKNSWQNFVTLIYVNCLYKYLYQRKIIERENSK